ncbi:phytochrome-like protein cph2 [mine drainage metagenome]|uniref:Phytochrome-like protein cph2 n=1 Tax=mine drainage metagenome TaxID=410659 RepID=A0A1J5Q5K5_9ZZZZ
MVRACRSDEAGGARLERRRALSAVGLRAVRVIDGGQPGRAREPVWVAATRDRFLVRPVIARTFAVYVLVVVVAALIAPAAPEGVWLWAYGGVGAFALTALGVGVRVHHPGRRGAWLALFAAVCLSLVGDVMSSLVDGHGLLLTHASGPLAVGVVGDVVLAGAVVALTWTSGRAAVIAVTDAWIAGILAGLCIWAALLVWLPTARRNADVLTLTGYSLVTVVALAAAFPLLFSGPKRIGSPLLLVAGVAALMVSGTAGGIALLAGSDQLGTWYGAGTLAGYGLLGTAALAPSMSRIGAKAAGGVRTTPGTGRIEVVLVGLALVIPLTLQLLKLPNAGGFSPNAEGTIDLTFTIFEVALVALVVVRMTLANSDRRRAGSELLRLAAAIEQTGDAVWICDDANRVRYANPAFTVMSGWSLKEILGRDQRVVDGGQHSPEFWSDVAHVVNAAGVWRGEVTNRRRDGTLVELDATISVIRDENDNITGCVHTDRDVTRERELESAVAREAREHAAVEASLAHIRPDSSVGDIAKAACAELRRLDGVRAAAVIDLTVGAESILAMSGLNRHAFELTPSGVGELGDYLRANLAQGPCLLAYASHPHSPRVQEQEPGENLPLLVAYAPLVSEGQIFGALAISASDSNAAGALGARLTLLGTLTAVLAPLLRARLDDLHATNDAATSIRAILAERLFSPVFQPIVELASGAIVGFEALTRFTDGRRPDVVFAQAHRAGLGNDLERATLVAALGAARDLPADAYLTLNMSPDFLTSAEPVRLLDGVRRALVIEVTEHEVIEDYTRLRAHLAALRPRVRLAIDDAGAGYASLRHILELEPEIVKLDIAIVRAVDTDPGRRALVDGMKYFADKRQITLIAEGVETATELAALREIGIPNAQGFFLARPAPADAQARADT